MPPGVELQERHCLGGDRLPLRVEQARGRVEERLPGHVAALERPGGEAVHRVTQRVPRQHVHPSPEDERRHGLHHVQQRLHAGADELQRAAGVARTGQVEQVLPLGPIQPEDPGDRVQHRVGDVAAAALLQPDVVVGADAGQLGQLLTPQARHAPPPVGGQPDIPRLDRGTPGSQERADVCLRSGHAAILPRRGRPSLVLPDLVSSPTCLPPANPATLVGMNSYDLRNRTAVITGAASGMGAATAELLAASGARVVLLSRRRDRLGELAAQITSAGGAALALPVDITDPEQVTAAAARVPDADLVINSAGVMLPNPITDGRSDEWARMIDTNLTGALHVIRAFLPGVRAAAAAGRPADLVNISSIAAHVTFPAYAVYSATKAALTQLSTSLRTELGAEMVRVTNIEPGLTDTELGGHIDNTEIAGQLDGMFQLLPALRAEDIADLIGYVVSRPRHVNLRQLVALPTPQA